MINFGRSSAKYSVHRHFRDRYLDDVRMDIIYSRPVGTSGDDIANQVRLNEMANFRAKCLFHASRAWRETNDLMRRMVWLKRAGQELGGQEFKVVSVSA